MGDVHGDPADGRVAGPRCIAIVGPFASGKTTLLEAILARTGAISRQGTVAGGNTVGDASPEARAHAMSVEANFADTDYLGDRYTFIDCPGSVEFLTETDGVLGGVDMAIVVAEADEKKVPALQLILKALEARRMPRVLFLNKIDKADRRVREVLEVLQPASAVPLVLRQIPIWKQGIAMGFIDLALERAFVYREHAESLVIDIPDDEQAREVEARFSMLERLADHDDVLMEALLEDMAPGRERVFADLVTEMRDGLICPVFIGSAEHGNGILRLMKALRHEGPGIASTRARLGLAEGVDAVQVIKTLHTPHGGKLSLARVLSGTVGDATMLVRADGSEAKVSGVFSLTGQQASKRAAATAGETVGLGKLEGVATGETLGVGKAPAAQLAPLAPPEPVLGLAVAAAERKDEVKLSSALTKLVEEDPSYRFTHAQETGETLLEGQGEMHLRVAQERLKGKYGLSLEVHAPAVPYRETIRAATSVRGRHKKQSGGHGQFGDAALEIRPLPRGEGFVFSDTITGGVVPKQYIPSVRDGVAEALNQGPLGFPVVDIAVTLTDGSYHSVDSSDQAFKMAAILAMREGLPQCKPVLLEPIHEVTVACPSEATPRINAIISGRRGQLLGFDGRPGWDGWDEVRALMPEADIGDLIVELRSATAGVASYTKRFDHLAELTGKAADQALARSGRQAA
ncbi:elongation factor G [Polymorphum gilvum]|uniref:Elongation factor G n=1 Tax=Polymorphum gilvum (strain LMG 25793 / CGMCC 1.9160 / SL003B-26A1) TaxID=991905 RepID=F2J0L3_POLGS|nr:elongation factor G [Polymorphum gilvum]ADZ69680.1 Translation elongation factor EF-G [Polymorphum gilvum SL003B-26A1]